MLFFMLKECAQKFFTAKELKPTGWLKRQLEIQAGGLSGNLDKVWPDISDSRWIGGNTEGWERVPYWLDGFIPLAWLLENEDMQARAKRYIDAILAGQQPDGWICPCTLEERGHYDIWAAFLICKVLVVYHDCTEDERIEKAIYKTLQNLQVHLEHHTLFDWSAARWFEGLISIFWLYERCKENWLLDLAYTLRIEGFNYEELYRQWRFQKPRNLWTYTSHVVNLAMSLKSQALFSRMTDGNTDEMAKLAYSLLMRDHGMPTGHFSGDECISGTSPIQGSELCSVVEAMYSYEWLLSITGDPCWADILESVAYNALPAAISPDMWSHQYDQMTNQVACTHIPDELSPFRTNNGEAHLFGLEPHFGCCTANFSQGWPKLALSTLMRRKDGIAIGAIAPCCLKTEINGINISCEIVTNYPFEDGYQVVLHTQSPIEMSLYLRVPQGVKKAGIDGETVDSGSHKISRVWNDGDTAEVRFAFEPEFVPRPSGMSVVRRGSLLFSVPLDEEWEKFEYTKNGVERKFPYCDYEVTSKTAWNYAFAQNKLSFAQGHLGDIPFGPKTAPVFVTAKLYPVEWDFENGVCSLKPQSLEPTGEVCEVKMIPYGCTNLRMTEMPTAWTE